MNKKKLYNEIINHYLKGDKLHLWKYGDYVGISFDESSIYFDNIIDFPFIFDRFINGSIYECNKLIPPIQCKATITNELRVQPEIKRTIVKLSGDGIECWINTKYMKLFDDNAVYCVAGEKLPVMVYENDIPVGLIMPVQKR